MFEEELSDASGAPPEPRRNIANRHRLRLRPSLPGRRPAAPEGSCGAAPRARCAAVPDLPHHEPRPPSRRGPPRGRQAARDRPLPLEREGRLVRIHLRPRPTPTSAPTVDRPLVYYLFGRFDDPRSLVLTEDDYFDYLIGLTRNNELVPAVVRRALVDTALLVPRLSPRRLGLPRPVPQPDGPRRSAA